MFRKIRLRTASYQIILICVVLLAVFIFNCIYTYETMINDVDEHLQKCLTMGDIFFEDNPPRDNETELIRNSFAIKVYKNGMYELSNRAFYDDETIMKIVSVSQNGSGKKVINNKHVAYLVDEDKGIGYYIIHVYDYSKEFASFIHSILTILYTCLAVMCMGIYFVIHINKRNFSSIENAFNKQQELVANASHELKTPLTIINTNLSILNLYIDEFNDEQKKWLNGISTQVSKMSVMINEMLELARYEAVREKDFQTVNFSEVVESVVLETEPLAFEKQVELISEVNPKIKISARKTDVEKLVFILVENAMKYTEPNGTITVKLTSERHKACLRIRNTGEGIPRDKMPKLFDRFYRCEESHTTSGSFGLGLSIAKAITDANKGTIGVDSRVGHYTEFIVIFKEE